MTFGELHAVAVLGQYMHDGPFIGAHTCSARSLSSARPCSGIVKTSIGGSVPYVILTGRECVCLSAK